MEISNGIYHQVSIIYHQSSILVYKMNYNIGIDIGSQFVKVIQVGIDKNKPHIYNVFLFPTPYLPSVASPEPQSKKIDAKDFFGQIVSQIPINTLKNSYIGINIPPHLVTVMVVQIPKMSKNERRVAAIAEVKRKMVPAPGPGSIFEQLLLGDIVINGNKRDEILVVKTDKSCIDEILNIFESCGEIRPTVISPTCFTILNCFSHNSEIYKKYAAFIDIGYNDIDITIANQGKLNFYRNMHIGLKDIFAHIAGALNVTIEQIEQVINDKGIPSSDIDIHDKVKAAEEIMRQKYEDSLSQDKKEEINSLELRVAWETEIERIIQEIRRTLVYYHEQSGGRRADIIMFIGGGAEIQGLVPALAKGIGDNAQVFHPLKDMDISLKDDLSSYFNNVDSLFASALSLALNVHLYKKGRDTINFLPRQLKEREIIFTRQWMSIIICVILIIVSIFTCFRLFINNKYLRISLKDIDIQINKLNKVYSEIEILKNEEKNINLKLAGIGRIIKKKVNMPIILKEMMKHKPQNVFVKTFSFSKKDKSSSSADLSAQNDISNNLDETSSASVSHDEKTAAVENWTVKIIASCFCSYEEAADLAKSFKENIEKNNYFNNVELFLPKLEKITPLISHGDVVLTQQKLREFELSADIKSR